MSPSRVLRAPGTSPYHLVPKHLWTTWSRPEQSHLLPEACSPNGTDKRRQRQRQTERPPPEPSDTLKRSRLKLRKKSCSSGLNKKSKFSEGPVSPNFPARRSVMMILNLSESLAKLLVLTKLNMAHLLRSKKQQKLLSSYLPVSPSRVLRAPGTSPYHLVPKHLRTTWSRPEQSHLLPEACSPYGTDKRRQRQRQTERPPPEPSGTLKKFHLKLRKKSCSSGLNKKSKFL